ncbi:Asp23/Gls24 family envelope stress response protein [Herbiconiux sp. UC225_62]|uniref:Asp23/Gls24 family envelope stress response protein n=1 Tax=Herbiconiux sp. UC225_62 TaxID=3350168 RepID=UPI0036D2E161
MSDHDDLVPESGPPGFEPDDLDGHTIEELSDYLDAGRSPADPSIDSSPGCQTALAALQRLRTLSAGLLDAEARNEPEPEESWIGGILKNIGREAHTGRSIPLPHPDPAAALAITEGSVRGLVRAAGDTVQGLLVGRCTLVGDVTVPGEPITIAIDAVVYWGHNIPEATSALREAVAATLARHTDLHVVAIDVTVHDVQMPPTTGDAS